MNEIEDRKREEEEHLKWKELVDKVKRRGPTVTGSTPCTSTPSTPGGTKEKTAPLVRPDPGTESPSKRKRGPPSDAVESTPTQVNKTKPSETDRRKAAVNPAEHLRNRIALKNSTPGKGGGRKIEKGGGTQLKTDRPIIGHLETLAKTAENPKFLEGGMGAHQRGKMEEI